MIITLDQYQQQCPRFARFPAAPISGAPRSWDKGGNIGYISLGVVEEMGEVLDASPAERPKEIGDVFWYCAMAAEQTGHSLSHLYQMGESLPLKPPMQIARQLAISKKLIRDSYSQGVSATWFEGIALVLGFARCQLETNGLRLDQVLQGNLIKLEARQLTLSANSQH